MTTNARLSMLWESTDPAQALTARFGFATTGDVTEWLRCVLHRHWNLDLQRCDRLVISSSNALAWVQADGRPLIVKWSAAPPLFKRLAEVAQLSVWLADEGIPVAAAITSTRGRPTVVVDGTTGATSTGQGGGDGPAFSVTLLPVLDGDLLDVGSPDQVIDAGRMLATVHDALATYHHHVGDGPAAAHEQLIHNDFRAANIPHSGDAIVGVLDLEEVTYGTRVADVGKAAVLLGTLYRDWSPTPEGVRARFVDAYRERAALTSADERELNQHIAATLRYMGWA